MGQKLLVLLFILMTSQIILAQKQSKLDIALRYVEENATKWDLVKSDYQDMMVSHISVDDNIGATYVYFNQANKGIMLKNAMLILTIDKNGKVVHAASNFVPNFLEKIKVSKNVMKANDAVVAAAKYLGVVNPERPNINKRNDNGVITFDDVAYTDSPITAELKYALKGDKIVTVWEATMDMAANADYWEIRMNAEDGSFVSNNNLTVYCQHQHGKYAKHNNCNAEKMAKSEDNSLTVASALAGAAYRVYELPIESPIYGPSTLVVNPAFPETSPFGWHDTDGVEGPEYTITRGNNVFAYTDKNNDDVPDDDIAQPNGGPELIFDFVHDQTKDPLFSPDAAQTNLFYINNMMHDITALYGFDEQSGNFQATNYSGKGKGNDYVLAQAFDGFELATPTLDNANFATPADGSNGRMQMFLWSVAGGAISIDSPDQIKGFVTDYGTADFGDPIPPADNPAITGSVAIAHDSDPTNPTQCCGTIIDDLTGKIALVDRGICEFGSKVYHAQQAGAIAVLICNIAGVNGGNGEELSNMTGGVDGGKVTIPSIFVQKSTCEKIRASINGNIDVTMTLQERTKNGPKYLDGAFDNGIIAHEYAHGISTRLTGGPTNSGCLNNEEQMGEGWSDWFALITTVEPGDKGTDVRGIGNYAISSNVNGGGIRRYPYSTDMNVNPQTFDNIKGTAEVHNTGEIWTDMLWDLYWALVDKYGYDANWRNFDSGNARALKLVIQGMKMQGCNPGFVEGRNAILDADSLLYGGDNGFLIWDIFARRGLGFNANSGSTNDVNDGFQNFEPHPLSIQKLKITKTATGAINAGDDITITLKAINHVPEKQTGVVITDDIPDGASFIASSSNMAGTVSGSKVTFNVGDMEYKQELTITYRLSTSQSASSSEIFNYDFENGTDWNPQSIKGTAFWYESDLAQHSGDISYFVPEVAAINDQTFESPEFNVSGDFPVLRFWHKYDTENGIDGGFVQVSTDAQHKVWQTIKASSFVRNGYNNVIGYSTFAIPSLDGFSGTTNGQFIDSYLDLSSYKGNNIKVRFRFGSDDANIVTNTIGGWFMDDVALLDLKKYEGVACISSSTPDNGTCSLPTRTLVNGIAVGTSDVAVDHFKMDIYPNPAHQSFSIMAVSPYAENANVVVRSLEGKEVIKTKMSLSDQPNVMVINTSTLTAGMYIVSLQNGENVTSRKLIVK